MNTYGRTGTPFLFILDFDLLHPHVFPADEARALGLRYTLPGLAGETINNRDMPREIQLLKSPVPFELYEQGFNRVMEAIQAGDTYLLNLCYTTPVAGVTSLENIYRVARAPYKLLYPGKFVVFSPEQFVSITDGVIRTYPMKGTIDAAIPGAEQILLHDIKEKEEHATVVDLLRNDLSIVADQVIVEKYRYITSIKTSGKTLLQCSTAIRGQLAAGYRDHLGDILQSLLPAGSVTGAPKKRTVEIIHATEPEPRGYYTGVFGYFDGENLDSAVMIRFIEQREERYYYKSGGGITYQSVAALEYREMLDKVYVPVS